MRRAILWSVIATLGVAPAFARPIEFTFTGTVASTPTDSIQLNGPAGRTPYAGANAPTYPVTAGEQLTVTFTGYSDTIDRIMAQPGFDPNGGPIRVPLSGPNNGTPDRLTSIGIGSIGGNGTNAGQSFGGGGLDLLFDPVSAAYSLDFGADGVYAFGTFNLPSYTYDPVADIFSPGRTQVPTGGYTMLKGDDGSLTFSDLPIFRAGTDQILGYLAPLVLNGSYSIPVAGSTPVPAPPAFALFAASAALLAYKRQRRRRRG